MTDTTQDDDFYPASAGDDPIWLGGVEYITRKRSDDLVQAERDKVASIVAECLWGSHWTHWRLGAVDPQDLAAAIREGGE